MCVYKVFIHLCIHWRYSLNQIIGQTLGIRKWNRMSLSSGIYSPGEWKTNEQIITVQRCVLCLRKYSVGTKKDHLYQAEGWVSPEAPWRHWLLNWGLQSEKEVEFGLVKKGLGKRSGIGRRMSVPGLCLCKDPESRDTLAIHKLKRVCMVQA